MTQGSTDPQPQARSPSNQPERPRIDPAASPSPTTCYQAHSESQWPTPQKPSPKPKARQTPDHPRHLPTQMFFEFVKGGCQFCLSRKAVPYLGTSKGKGFLSFGCVFLGQSDISICVAEVAGRTRTIFIEQFTKVFWGKILQGLESYNL